MARQNTKLESEGAEFLVLGTLLCEGMPAYKMYVGQKGYDLIAVNPEDDRVARVSVKMRWKANAAGFIINDFQSDFVVVVKLNKGSKVAKLPEIFVIPTHIVEAAPRDGQWGKTRFKAIPDFESYKDAWHLIRDYLKLGAAAEPAEEEG